MVFVSLVMIRGVFGGELLPFPAEQAVQKSVPAYYTTFKDDISKLSCTELNQLNDKLVDSLKNATNASDNNNISYYSDLIKIVNDAKRDKCS